MRVAKYPTKRPVLPARAVSTAARAASRSSPSQKSIHELFRKGAMSQISSTSFPPSFMNTRRPSRSRTLMQSRLQAISRLLNSSLARRDSEASSFSAVTRSNSDLVRRASS